MNETKRLPTFQKLMRAGTALRASADKRTVWFWYRGCEFVAMLVGRCWKVSEAAR